MSEKLEPEMPERIWAGDLDNQGFGHCVAGMQGGLYEEYVLASALEAKDARIAELERENAALAAHACIFTDGSGLTGDEHGKSICLVTRRATAAEAEAARLRGLLEEAGKVLEFVRSWAWRDDPPSAARNLSDRERLLAIKYHPAINCHQEPKLDKADVAKIEVMAHPDDLAVDRFAAAMKAKLAKKRTEGKGGWEDKEHCSNAFLSHLLFEHVQKGDPVDVGNLAMMIHQRGEAVSAPDEYVASLAQLNAIVDAWEALPGGRQVKNRDVERWLAKHMGPGIDAIRGFLRRPRPDGILPLPPLPRQGEGRMSDKLRLELPGVSSPVMDGDNLAITLASFFEPSIEGDDMDESGTWKQGAIDAANEVMDAIHAHYADEIERLRSELSTAYRRGREDMREEAAKVARTYAIPEHETAKLSDAYEVRDGVFDAIRKLEA